jgi:transposase
MKPAILKQPQTFVIPKHIPHEEQVDYCLDKLNKYRRELKPLRRQISDLMRWRDHWRERSVEWEEKYKESQKENEKMKSKIGKLEKENHKYRIALFDRGNFKKPGESKKKKGGQPGHENTNREKSEDYMSYERKRLFLTHCTKCKTALGRTKSAKEKILLDIVVNPEIVKLVLESERQWCGNCKKEVHARDERSLPFTEYGINTFMMVLLLRYRCCLPLSKITMVLKVGYGLNISKSGVDKLLKQSKKYLKSRYDELMEIVRKGEIMYNDETGWKVRKKQAWMWIMANEEATVYWASESRGKGNIEEMYGNSESFSMHDGYGSYEKTIPQDKTMYCWAHILRFVHEEAYKDKKGSQIMKLKDKLVKIYHLKDKNQGEKLREKLKEDLEIILNIEFTEASAIKVQNRLKKQKTGLINALMYTKDGTNNLAERELRQVVIARKISFGSDTYGGMETTAILASVIQTLSKNKDADFFGQLAHTMRKGIKQKYYPL